SAPVVAVPRRHISPKYERVTEVITAPVLLVNCAPYWIGVTVPLPTLPSARSVAEVAPKLYPPPALLEPVPTTYCPSAAAPVPVSTRYHPSGNEVAGEVLLLRLSNCSVIPAGEAIDTEPLPVDPLPQTGTDEAHTSNRIVRKRDVPDRVTSLLLAFEWSQVELATEPTNEPAH